MRWPKILGSVVLLLLGGLPLVATAGMLYSYEDGTTEGWTATIVDSAFDDSDSRLSIVPGPGNTDGQHALRIIGRSGGFVRNASVILDAQRVGMLNDAVRDGWSIAFDWTIVSEENPGAEMYVAQLSVGSTAGWTQLDMYTVNGFPVWDPQGPNIQTMSPSIPLAGFGSGELGYNGVALSDTSAVYFLNIALSGGGETAEERTYYLDNFRLIDPAAAMPGDFNRNTSLDLGDIDQLTKQSAAATDITTFDLNADSFVDYDDIKVWVKDLFGGWIGDADLNGEFNSGDLVVVLAAGTYETGVNSVWSTGDFNGDGVTDSGDLVVALSDGGYERGSRPATAPVPEPAALCLWLSGCSIGLLRHRNFKRSRDAFESIVSHSVHPARTCWS